MKDLGNLGIEMQTMNQIEATHKEIEETQKATMVSMEDCRGENPTTVNKYACACAIIASMISIIFGYDTGVMSGAIIFIKEDLKIKDSQVEVLAGILNLCALIGSLAAGKTSDYIGRRLTIFLASIIFFIGAVLMGYGPSYLILMVGRCISGIGVGFALMIAPIYAAEISSPSSRGFLTSLPELCISIGILFGYVSNYFLGKLSLKLGWRLMLGIAAIPSLALAIGILKMPESPRWLVLQGRLSKAKKILFQVSNDKTEAEARFRDITHAAGITYENSQKDIISIPKRTRNGDGVWRELLVEPTRAVRWILLAAIGIHFFEHATGIEAVILYSPRIFKKAGITSKDKLLLAIVGVGLTKIIFILCATFFIDKVGRRKLLLTSVTGMILALSMLGFSLTMMEHSHDKLWWTLSLGIVTTYLYVAFFSIGLGPITWVYSSEIFPLRLRAQGYSIGVAVNRVINAVVSMTFMSLYKAITIGGAFFLFAGVSFVALVFFYFCLPETKGKSLEEMEMVFTRTRREENEGIEIQPRNDV